MNNEERHLGDNPPWGVKKYLESMERSLEDILKTRLPELKREIKEDIQSIREEIESVRKELKGLKDNELELHKKLCPINEDYIVELFDNNFEIKYRTKKEIEKKEEEEKPIAKLNKTNQIVAIITGLIIAGLALISYLNTISERKENTENIKKVQDSFDSKIDSVFRQMKKEYKFKGD